MATYAFPDVAGGSLVFVPAQDLLVFPLGTPAAALRFTVLGGDLLVNANGESVRLLGIGLGGVGLAGPNLVFLDGSLLVLDGNGSNTRVGGAGSDWFAIDRGGFDTVSSGAGDDRIEAGSQLGFGDVLHGAEGTRDTLALSGTVQFSMAANSATGFERIEVGDGNVTLTLDAATVATSTPGPGEVFTVDASGQGIGSRLSLNGASVLAAGMALLGGAGDDSLTGGFAADLLLGGAGDDTLRGGWGDDTIEGGAGADLLEGGPGDDLFRFDRMTGSASPPATPDLILDFAGAGQPGGDRIALPGSVDIGRALAFHVAEADFAFEGYADSGLQLPTSQVGDGYADVLWRRVEGLAWRFEVWADLDDNGRFGPGDLFLRVAVAPEDGAVGFIATDFAVQFNGFFGGEGNDTLIGAGPTDDAMWGQGGDDLLDGGDGVDVLEGGLGDDTLLGGDLADELRGGPGSDWLEGGSGWDTLFAADIFTPETESPEARNLLSGGAGPDLLFGGLGLDTLLGGDDDDLLWGDEGADSLDGAAGSDILHGREGADRLDGGEGDDTLIGGAGADTLVGGAGADLFIIDLSTSGQAEATGAELDWIVDFNMADGDQVSLGLIDGVVGGALGAGPLAWRGALAPRDLVAIGFGSALPGDGIGPGYYQAWWLPALAAGQPAGGWFVVDLDQDLILDTDDAVIRVGAAGPSGTQALTPASFAQGTFRVQVGTAGADVLSAAASGQEIFGLGGADRLAGQAGRDRLVGGEGNDTLLGGGGGDQLWGGAGNDWMDGEEGDDEIFVEGPGLEEVDGIFARNTLVGGLGNDSLWGADGRELLDGGDGHDWLYGGVGIDTLRGGAGSDTLVGGDGADFILGGEGADSIDAGSGDDTVDYDPADPFVDGGDDNDLLVVFTPVSVTLDSVIDQVAGGGITRGFEGVDASAVAGAVTLLGSAGRNRLIGGAFADRIEGRDGNDTLEGGAGDDTLDGGAGDDMIEGGPGADSMVGGAGVDTLSYAGSTVGVTVSLFSGTGSGGAEGDVFSGFEALRGSAFADRLDGTVGNDRLEGLAEADTITAYSGNDTLIGGAGPDVLLGGPGTDSLMGGSELDILDGGDGNDVLDGGEGIDRLFGQAGNDLYRVDNRLDFVVEPFNGGDDTVLSSVSYYLYQNVEWLVLDPGAGTIFGVGNSLANRFLGNEANNVLVGLAGDDTIWGGDGSDQIQGNDGDDVLFGEDSTDYIFGGNQNDRIDGGLGRDFLYGDNGNDTLFGGTDNITDALYGGNGDDWLDGGPGYDLLYGGFGNDVYVASMAAEGIFELPGQGWDRVIARMTQAYTLPENVEEMTLDGAPTGIGNALSNRITGSARNEVLFGRDGSDTLVGGGGNDVMFGEAGRDTFIFTPGSGLDVIGAFIPGEDRIMLQGFAINGFAGVLAATRQGSNGAIIDFGPGDSVQLTGVAKEALLAGDFVFLL